MLALTFSGLRAQALACEPDCSISAPGASCVVQTAQSGCGLVRF